MRIVHLLSPMSQSRQEDGSGEDAQLLLPLLLAPSATDVQQKIWAMEAQSAQTWSRRLAGAVRLVPMRFDFLPLNVGDLRHMLEGEELDALHAWGLKAAVVAGEVHGRLAGSVPWQLTAQPGAVPPNERDLAILREHYRHPDVCLAVVGEGQKKTWQKAGIPEANVFSFAPPSPPLLSASRHITPRTPHSSPTLLVLPAPSVSSRPNDAAWAGAILRQFYPDLRLIVYGDGPAAEAVRRFAGSLYVPDMTRLVGWDTPLADLISQADVVLFTGEEHASLTPLAWAMALGVPVVAAETEAVAGWVEHEATGLLYRPHAPRELAAMTLRLLDDGSLADRLAQSAQKRAAERCSPRGLLERYREWWER